MIPIRQIPTALLVLGALLISMNSPITAAEVYKWTDSQGITHFTDSLNKVPLEYRSKKTIKLPVYSSSAKEGTQRKKTPEKYKVWFDKCASCHIASGGADGEIVSLTGKTINKTSLFPKTVDALMEDLRFAVSGRWSDMSKVDVTDEELNVIAEYLLKENQ